jgi:2-amino-4-hydroxy-6-hydroxymethyldihydropteridine diphosphokinase
VSDEAGELPSREEVEMYFTSKRDAYLGLGSNLGDRINFIKESIRRLHVPGVCEVVKISPLYETKPWGRSDVPSYLNCAIQVSTDLVPRALMIHGHLVERRLGRTGAQEKWAPRNIDIDLLLYGDKMVVNNPSCMVPHPMLHLRAFALKPLCDINEKIIHPVFEKPIKELFDSLTDEDRFTIVQSGSVSVEDVLNARQPFIDISPNLIASSENVKSTDSDSKPSY